MRDLQVQTPQREQNSANTNRRLKTVPDLKLNMRKTSKKSLDPAFRADSGDDSAVLESPKEFSEVLDDNPFAESAEEANSGDDSAVLESLKEFSEALDDNPFVESAEDCFASPHPAVTHSSESVAILDLTSTLSSSSVTSTPCKHVIIETAHTKKSEVDSFKMGGSVEAELVLKHLREARTQVLLSTDVGTSKNLVEALINIIIKEIHGGVYEDEEEWLDKLLSKKSNLIFLICIMFVCSLLMVWLLHQISTASYTGPAPT